MLRRHKPRPASAGGLLSCAAGSNNPKYREGKMAIRPEKFWGSNYYNNPPLTDAMIAAAERQLGVRLPSQYIALLRIQNGGYTRHDLICPLGQDPVPLRALNGIVPGADITRGGIHNILLTEYMTKEWGLPSRQVLLDGDGHTWVSLDYRDGDEPSVVWIDAEMGREEFLAETFADFFAALRKRSATDD
jgi:hypothetical protein